MGVHICNPSPEEAESGRTQVGGQPGLRNEMLSQVETKPLASHHLLLQSQSPLCLSEAQPISILPAPPPLETTQAVLKLKFTWLAKDDFEFSLLFALLLETRFLCVALAILQLTL